MISKKKHFHIFLKIILLIILGFMTQSVSAAPLYFVDAHSQIDHKVDMNIVLKRMNENNVQTSLLSARGKRSDTDIIKLAEKSAGRIVASIRTKGRKYKKNKPEFYRKLKKQSCNGKFGALAEVIMYHAKKGGKAKEVEIYPDDERVHAALKAAEINNWPFVAHIEFASLGSRKRQQYMQGFKSLLKENPTRPVLLIHLGQLQPETAEILLEKYTNLYLMTSHADPITTNRSSQPWVNMFKGNKFKPQWKALLLKYPERFIFALDNVWARHWEKDYSNKMNLWRDALADIPLDIAEKIAHGNAERLYQLN